MEAHGLDMPKDRFFPFLLCRIRHTTIVFGIDSASSASFHSAFRSAQPFIDTAVAKTVPVVDSNTAANDTQRYDDIIQVCQQSSQYTSPLFTSPSLTSPSTGIGQHVRRF
jgi:hypothetical protein